MIRRKAENYQGARKRSWRDGRSISNTLLNSENLKEQRAIEKVQRQVVLSFIDKKKAKEVMKKMESGKAFGPENFSMKLCAV